MKLAHAVAAQLLHLLDRDRRSDQPPRLRIVLESFEALTQPDGDARATPLSKTQHLRKARDGKYPRHERRVDARCGAAIPKAQEDADIVEELRDRAGGA